MERAFYFSDPFFHSLVQVYLFLLGLIVGSFLNVCIHRIPIHESIVTPRSRCPHCRKIIPWYWNIPLLSYLLLQGRCAYCKGAISIVYPFVELVTGILFVLLYRSFGLSVPFFLYAIFGCSTIVLIFIDHYHRLLPAVITIPGILVGFLGSFFNPLVTPMDSLFGLLLGAGILTFVFFTFKWIRKKEGLGDGDIVMLAMVGAFLGWHQVLLVLFFSSLLGSLVGLVLVVVFRKGSDFLYPYGSFIGAAALPAIFWGEHLWQLYMR